MTSRLRPNFARALAVLALLPVSPALSHDLWIKPWSFAAVGSEPVVSLKVGEHFRGDPVPRMDPLIARFVLASGDALPGALRGKAPWGFDSRASVGRRLGEPVGVADL